jgi:hypothetical protein
MSGKTLEDHSMSPAGIASNNPHDDLLRRVQSLEQRLEDVEARLGLSAAQAPEAQPEPAPLASTEFGDTSALAGLLGISLLGLAFAYLLRAFTERGSLPVAAGVAVGLLYALAWLIWSARTPAAETLTVALRALTSVLIMGPLLWEALLRFQAITAWQTASVLVIFSVFGLAISWRKNLTAVALISSLAGLFLGGAFLLRTHDLLPFTTALLALAIAVEASACLEHYLGERWVVAALADLAVLLATFVATRSPGAAESYAPLDRSSVLALHAALVLIYLASTVVRTLGRGFRIAAFEVAQCAAAALIASTGALAVAQGHPAAVLSLGLFWTILGAACYTVSFFFLTRRASSDRNFHTYATFGLALALAGTWLLLHGWAAVALWSALALAFLNVARESGRMTLKLHAAAYLVLATFAAGLALPSAARFLTSAPHPAAAGAPPAAWIAAAASLAAWVLLLRAPVPALSDASTLIYRSASFLIAASALWNLAGLGSLAVTPLCHAIGAGADIQDLCPSLLTAVLIAVALSAAFAFRRFQRPELKWMAWLLLGAASAKLLLQDFHQAQTFSIVVSLVVYGSALALMPRLVRRASASPAEQARVQHA